MLGLEFHKHGKLVLEIDYKPSMITVKWTGESTEDNPIEFISPIFDEIYAKDPQSQIVLDFTVLEYMNSSTVSPILKQIQLAKKAKRKLTIYYKKGLKWQELSFSALRVFGVRGEIEIIGI